MNLSHAFRLPIIEHISLVIFRFHAVLVGAYMVFGLSSTCACVCVYMCKCITNDYVGWFSVCVSDVN